MNQIESRIVLLERRLAFQQRVIVGIGLFAGCLLTIGAARPARIPDLIQARKFQVVDTRGEVFASVASQGGAGLVTVYGRTGPVCTLSGEATAESAMTGVVRVLDDHGNRLVEVGGDNDTDDIRSPSHGYLSTFRANDTVLTTLGATDDGFGSIATYATEDKPLVVLGATEDGEGGITVSQRSGVPLVTLGANEDGDGYIGSSHHNGRDLVEVTSAEGVGQVIIHDPTDVCKPLTLGPSTTVSGVSTRRLTPACSGLATLAADARR